MTGGFTFPKTVNSLITAGYDVRLSDTTRGGFALSPEALRSAVERYDVKVVCLTHFLGFPGRIEVVREICDQHDIRLLQDACETMDLRVGDRTGHSFGDVTTWSFYHPHHLPTYGRSAVISCSEAMHSVVESIVHWGRACRCHDRPDLCEAPAGLITSFGISAAGIIWKCRN